MCKNYDADVPNNYPTVEPSNDYSEVATYDRNDRDYYDVPKDLFETIGQAIIDACNNDDEDVYSDEDDSSSGDGDDDNDEEESSYDDEY